MLLSCLCAYVLTLASPGDSLLAQLSNAQSAGDHALQASYHNKLAFNLYKQREYDSALHHFRRALHLSRLSKDDTLSAQHLNNIGMVHYAAGRPDSALLYYDRALVMFRRQQMGEKASVAGLNLSIKYSVGSCYEKALELGLGAVPYLKQANSLRALGSCYNTIALIYHKLSDFHRALEFHHHALAARKQTNNQRGMAQSYNNIANLYKDSKVYDSAMLYYQHALALKSANDRPGMASTLNNMGEVMLATNRLSEAEKFFRESLEIKKETGNKAGEIYTLNNLARLALMKEDFALAARHLDITEHQAQELGLLDELRSSYELRIALLKEMNRPADAFRYSERLMVVKDSLMNQEKAEALAGIQIAYEVGERDKQIALLEKESALQELQIAEKNAWMFGLSLAAVLSTIIIGLVYWQFRREQRNKEKIKTLLRELHHRVKNNLQMLSSVLSLYAKQLTDEQALQAVRSSESRVNAMALIHRKLYERSDAARSINIKDYITELITYLVHAYGYHEKEMRLDLTLEPIQVDIDKAIPLGLVINELISNAFKHAYVDHPSPGLTVGLKQEGKGTLSIDIADNGTGLRPEEETRGDSFGLKLVNMLMSELKGKYEIRTQEGTQYLLTIPLS
ncbi:MAG: tetratricopeptide repeat protein [Cyclobacteriaceae bacterium]|nr:tetratricopeptide repeat protein [Cyclobacteriaceae bacterium]